MLNTREWWRWHQNFVHDRKNLCVILIRIFVGPISFQLLRKQRKKFLLKSQIDRSVCTIYQMNNQNLIFCSISKWNHKLWTYFRLSNPLTLPSKPLQKHKSTIIWIFSDKINYTAPRPDIPVLCVNKLCNRKHSSSSTIKVIDTASYWKWRQEGWTKKSLEPLETISDEWWIVRAMRLPFRRFVNSPKKF